MTQIALIARLRAKPGRRDELLAALGELVSAVERESGTLVYLLHTDDADEDSVWFYELYADAAALEEHRTSDTMQRMKPRFGELLAEPIDVVTSELVGGKISAEPTMRPT